MPLIDCSSFGDWLKASVSRGVQINNDGSLELARSNKWPNQFCQIIGEDGDPVGHDLSGIPEKTVAYHILESARGAKPSTLTRQTSSPIGTSVPFWDGNQPVFPGVRPLGKEGPKPQPPAVQAVNDPTKGFVGATYGYAFGFRKRGQRPTPASGTVFFPVGNSQSIPCPLPDKSPAGADLIDLYLTPPNGTRLALQRSVEIDRLRGRIPFVFVLQGPWIDGPPPPTKNESGLTRPAVPRVTGPARFRDVVEVKSRHDLKAARYRFALQVEDDRGQTLLSVASQEIVVEPDTIREKVKVPAGEELPPEEPLASLDPSTIRPSGKLEGNEYLGWEVDFEESRLVGLLNERRRLAGVPELALSNVMNRTVYKQALGEEWPLLRRAREEGYEGEELRLGVLRGEAPEEALEGLEENLVSLNSTRWKSVGVARENPGEWTVVLGEPIGDLGDLSGPMRCLFVDAETGEEHEYGEEVEEGEVRAAVFNSWSLVRNGRMHYTYGGSYGSSVSHGASIWHAMGRVSVQSGGSECAITDGSMGPGYNAICYSDGRIILNHYYFANGVDAARKKVCGHEFGHALGFGHYNGNSIMVPTTNMATETNAITQLTEYDKDEYVRKYGSAPTPEPTPEPTPTPAPTPAPTPTEIKREKLRQIEINRQIQRTTQTTEQPVPTPPTAEPPAGTPAPTEPEFRIVTRTRVLGVKRGRCLLWRMPKVVQKTPGLRARYWVQINDVWHRARLKRASSGDGGSFRGSIKIHGYPPEEEPSGLAVGLVQEEPPSEDTTVLEAPDPSTVPDAPESTGSVLPDAGNYLAAVVGVLESGAETVPSDPTPYTLGLNQFPRVSPVKTVNRLVNPNFFQKDSTGTPIGWTGADFLAGVVEGNNGQGGVFAINCLQPTSRRARIESTPIRIDRESDVLTVAGLVEVSRHIEGAARVSLYEQDAAGIFVQERVALRVAGLGGVDTPKTFGPGYDEWHQSTDSVRVVVRIEVGASGNANLSMRVSGLQAVSFPTAIRRYQEGRKIGEPDSFDVPALLGLPEHSFVAVGRCPTPPGANLPEPEPPRSIHGFDAPFPSATDAGNGWSRAQNSISEVVPGAAIFGPSGWRVTQPVPGRGFAYIVRDDPGITGTAFLRFLWRVVVRPNFGEVTIARLYQGSQGFVEVRQKLDGTLWVYAYRPELGRTVGYQAAGKIGNGTVADLELSVSGGGTKNGAVSLSYAPYGSARSVIHASGSYDFRNFRPVSQQLGNIKSSDGRAIYEYHFDGVVVTRFGDVQNRERPIAPADRPTPVYDAPKKADGSARLMDQDGTPIHQIYFFVMPGQAPASNPAKIPLLDEPLPVKPGLPHTIALQGRHVVFTSEAAPGLTVTLVGPGLEPKPVGSVHGTGMNGARGWSDDFLTFDVPPPFEDGRAYTGARVELVLHDGVYVFQEHLHAEEALITPEARDAARGYGRATEGTFSVILPTHPPHNLGLTGGTWWARFGARRGDPEGVLPPGVGLDLSFASSDDRALAFLDESIDPDVVAPRNYARISGRFYGDGRNSAALPSGGAFLETWHPVGNLLREDRSEFPGAALVGNAVWDVSYPDAEVDRVAGRTYVAELTDDVRRIYGLTIAVYTEQAAKEIEENGFEEFVIEAPHTGDRVAGKMYRVRFRERPRFKPANQFVSFVEELEGERRRRLYASATIEEVEVLEVSPLLGFRDVLLSSEVS